jgi:hypothetical protein
MTTVVAMRCELWVVSSGSVFAKRHPKLTPHNAYSPPLRSPDGGSGGAASGSLLN